MCIFFDNNFKSLQSKISQYLILLYLYIMCPFFSQNSKFVIFQKFLFYLVAYDPDIKLETFSIIFDDPEEREVLRPFFPKFF